MKRSDIAKRRFLSWALTWAGSSGQFSERAEIGFDRALEGAEHGGIGIGIATFRRAERERSVWIDEIEKHLAARGAK